MPSGRRDDDPVVQVQAVVRGDQVRSVGLHEALETGDPHAIEEMDEGIDQRHLARDPHKAHSWQYRPAPGRWPRWAPRAASTMAISSPTLVSGWSASSSTKTPVSSSITPRSSTRWRESRSRSDDRRAVVAIDCASRPARPATMTVIGSSAASSGSRWSFEAAAGIGAETGRSRLSRRARMSGLRTLSVCVRGRSSSGQTVEPRISWCGREPRVGGHDDIGLRRAGSSSRTTAWTLADPRRGASPRSSASLHPTVLLEDRLDVLGVHLLPVGQGEHVLLPAAERQHPGRRECPEVARVVPALGDRSRRPSPRGSASSPPKRPGPRARISPSSAILTSTPGIGLPYRPQDVAMRPREADDRAHLGRAVALEDVHAHVRPALGDVDLERGRADADRAQPAPELAEHRAGKAGLTDALRDAPRDGDAAARTGRAWPAWSDLALDRASRGGRRPWGTISRIETLKSRNVRTSTAGWRLTG